MSTYKVLRPFGGPDGEYAIDDVLTTEDFRDPRRASLLVKLRYLEEVREPVKVAEPEPVKPAAPKPPKK